MERKAPPASAASVGAAIDHAIARLERQTSWEKIEAVGQVELTAEDLTMRQLWAHHPQHEYGWEGDFRCS